jgi:hypothetical protein
VNDQRLAFLDAIEADPAPSGPSAPLTTGRTTGRKVGALAFTFAAASAVFTLPVTAAQAAPVAPAATDVSVAAACSEPDPIPRTQSKWCNTMNYVFDYTNQWYHPGPALWRTCYIFDLTIYNAPCGGTVRVGRRDACD